jgi:hypothetical protein
MRAESHVMLGSAIPCSDPREVCFSASRLGQLATDSVEKLPDGIVAGSLMPERRLIQKRTPPVGAYLESILLSFRSEIGPAEFFNTIDPKLTFASAPTEAPPADASRSLAAILVASVPAKRTVLLSKAPQPPSCREGFT